MRLLIWYTFFGLAAGHQVSHGCPLFGSQHHAIVKDEADGGGPF
jgi:hypothetical protein